MLTPKFTCSQSSVSVVVEINAPAIRASEIEIFAEDRVFSLHVNPYFLRLQFPGNIVEDEKSSASYDPSSGKLSVTLSKQNVGEDFPDLDLLSKLLAPVTQPEPEHRSLVEVLDSQEGVPIDDFEKLHISNAELSQAEETNWQIPQSLPSDVELNLPNSTSYGFLNRYTGFLKNIAYTENEVNELGPDAEIILPDERRRRREAREDAKFDREYYMADFVDDEEITSLIEWPHPFEDVVHFTLAEEESLTLLRLPRHEYLISLRDARTLPMTLASILFAFAYDARSTMHDPTSESAWTISVLIPAFVALDTSSSSSLVEVFRASYRRALAYPLYRSWKFCEKCRSDVADILKGGVKVVLSCLLEVKKILDHHDIYYLYSKLWIDDYCVWVQRYISSQELSSLSHAVRTLRITKEFIGWGLPELEAKATNVREPDSDDESVDEVETTLSTML